MNTTIDREMIGRMVHSDCELHHCKDTLAANAESSKSTTIRGRDLGPPEFLHCGYWVSPQTGDQKDDDQDSNCTGCTRTRSWSPKDFSNVVDSWIIDNDNLGVPALRGLDAGTDRKG